MERHPFLNRDATIECDELHLRSTGPTDFRNDEVDLFEAYLIEMVTSKAPDIVKWLEQTGGGNIIVSYSTLRKKIGGFWEVRMLVAFSSDDHSFKFPMRWL